MSFSIATFSFQMKGMDDTEWVEVSDDAFMEELYKSYDRLTPYIKSMLDGVVIITGQGQFRTVSTEEG